MWGVFALWPYPRRPAPHTISECHGRRATPGGHCCEVTSVPRGSQCSGCAVCVLGKCCGEQEGLAAIIYRNGCQLPVFAADNVSTFSGPSVPLLHLASSPTVSSLQKGVRAIVGWGRVPRTHTSSPSAGAMCWLHRSALHSRALQAPGGVTLPERSLFLGPWEQDAASVLLGEPNRGSLPSLFCLVPRNYTASSCVLIVHHTSKINRVCKQCQHLLQL